MHGATWTDVHCDQPGDETDHLLFTYVGAFDDDQWIEAVKLRV